MECKKVRHKILEKMRNLIVIAIVFVLNVSLLAQDKLSQLRTSKQIVTVENASAVYTVQVLALRMPPSDANFFKNLDMVYEYPCSDGYVRYCVGQFDTFAEANSSLASVREKGYEESFVTNTKRFSVIESEEGQASKNIKIDPNKEYVVQLAAFRYPVYLSFFENVDDVYEYRLNDKIFRYTTEPVMGTEVESLLSKMKGLGYKKAFIVEYSKYAPFKIE